MSEPIGFGEKVKGCCDFLFARIVTMDQPTLKNWLKGQLEKNGYNPIVGDGFLFAKGTHPVALVAHMDTVHKETVKEIYTYNHDGKRIFWSPQGIGGDDRCGVYMILKVIEKYHCDVVFLEDEEIGCIGADKFAISEYVGELDNDKFIVEFDRRNADDAVYYDLDNVEFEEFVEKAGFKVNYGSFSDICIIAPEVGIAAVNLSCGYYDEHKIQHYVVYEEMLVNIKRAMKLMSAADECEQFKYVEIEKYDYGYGYNYSYNDYIVIFNDNGEQKTYRKYGQENDVLVSFFMDHSDIPYNEVVWHGYYYELYEEEEEGCLV